MSKYKFKPTTKKRIRISTDCNEKGMILIAALALISILALMATVSVITTYTEIKISSNYKTSVQASYAVQAGYEEARARLRGSPSDPIYIGDTSSPPNELWSVYVGTSSSWQTTDDPDYNPSYTNLGVNSLQSDISYWVKIRHKKWSDCTAAEKLTVDTSWYIPSDPDIIYYGYATSTATTAVQFTSDNVPYNASPVDIITSYGSSGSSSGSKSSNIVKVQTKKLSAPPIVGAIYGGADVWVSGFYITINGNDYCGLSDPVPSVDHVGVLWPLFFPTLMPASTQKPELDLATRVDELESTATVILTGDQTNYSVGSSSNYEIVFCDATQLGDKELDIINITGHGTLVVRGDISFAGTTNWNGLIIASGNITFNGGGEIYGALLAGDGCNITGSPNIYYSSCEIDNAKSSFRHPTSRWEGKK